MPHSLLRSMGLFFLVVLATGGTTWFVYYGSPAKPKGDTPKSERLSQKMGNILKIGAALAESYGIEATPTKVIDWRPQIFVDGRVLPNPNATLEVRAPFAGVLQANTDMPNFRIGSLVKAQQPLANFEARFSPLEKLDLSAKSVEAEARYNGAEEILKIRQDRVERLQLVTSGSISRGDLDAAAIQLSEARMQKDVAKTQWNIWRQALESVGKKSIIVPIQAPIAGEIAEIGAQPGSNVEAGQLLMRLVDFRRVLVRLDFPLTNAPPADVEVETLSAVQEAPTRWRAHLRGPAPNTEIGLQKAGYLYEIVPHDEGTTPNWRPGLYVKTLLNDPAKTSQAAMAIPASALLVHQGRMLVYVQLNPGRYERREVQVIGRAGETLYVSTGVREDESVVSKHAQALLSEEFRSDVDDD